MAAPKYEIVYKHIQNPDASAPLIIPILVLCNTSDEQLAANVRASTQRDCAWVAAVPAHEREAIMVGGGPSAAAFVDEIYARQATGACVFAINGASRWLRENGVTPDFQVIADAKPETATLVDTEAKAHLFASQCDGATFDAVTAPILWHLEIGDIEKHFPIQRKARGGYALIGGGAATGNSALCLAYAMGYRVFHIYGYDSCHSGGESHAYRQAMNDLIPTVDVEWAGKTYTASVAMKAQAEKFQLTGQALEQEGCTLRVYGEGLLQHMWTTEASNLSERDKYRLMWQFDTYREVSPGEMSVMPFLSVAKPNGLILDLGCGTGRAGLALSQAGFDVLLIDFADNCRDNEALGLPFLEWDLTRPCPARAPYGFCADVMEHIPPEQTDDALRSMFASAERIFFRIGTDDDVCGDLIGATLHVNVMDHAAWRQKLTEHGVILHEQHGVDFSVFYVERK